ncbi:MAG: gliding motility-associated C-terminal domain-containing protein [Bacteroidales bacterium]|nr:gliding motility-associated C-terminal domain-containing protein [Bacteroidales bacterium]
MAVFMREKTTEKFAAIDSVTYTANSTITDGSTWQCVYNGTGTSVNVSGLNEGTSYTVIAYEYNGPAGLEKYYTKDTLLNPATVSTLTKFVCPFPPSFGPYKPNIPINLPIPLEPKKNNLRVRFVSNCDIVVVDTVYTDENGIATMTIYSPAPSDSCNIGVIPDGGKDTIDLGPFVFSNRPTIQAHDIMIEDITGSSAKINWTRGNGDSCIVILKENGLGNPVLTDGETYASNSIYAKGSSINNSWYAIYKGLGNNVSVSGLKKSTTYRVAVFEYNSIAGTEYYLNSFDGVSDNPKNFVTLNSQISDSLKVKTNPHPVITKTKDTTEVEVTIVKEPGDYPVVDFPCRFPAPENYPKIFEVYPSIDTTNSEGKIVITIITDTIPGRDTLFVLTPKGEIIDTIVIEVEDYKVPTQQAHTIMAQNVGTTSVNLSWTRGNGEKCIVFAAEKTLGTPFVKNNTGYTASAAYGNGSKTSDNWVAVYKGTGTTVSVTGLKENTRYRFMVLEYNGKAGAEKYNLSTANLNPINIITLLNLNDVEVDVTGGKIYPTDTTMEYSVDGENGPWKPCLYPQTPENFYPGGKCIWVRQKSNPTHTRLVKCIDQQENKPNITINFVKEETKEILTQDYEYSYEEDFSPSTVGDGSSLKLEPGKKVYIRKKGTKDKLPSLTQILDVPSRPEVPNVTVNDEESDAAIVLLDGKPVKTSDSLEYQLDNGEWKLLTDNTRLNLKGDHTLYVRKKATSKAFASLPSNDLDNTSNGITRPTVQASNVVVRDSSATSATIHWTKGNGSYYVVFITAGDEDSAYPQDNTSYVANNEFGKGSQLLGTGWYCVYVGTDTFATISGLSPDTEYRVHVITFNGTTGNEKYCTAEGVNNPITVRTTHERTIKVYTVLTPNGDGINDFWIIDGIDLYPNNSVKVYVRGGGLVFEAKPYRNNWSGTRKGVKLPDGTYYYILDLGDGSKVLKGNVTIIH